MSTSSSNTSSSVANMKDIKWLPSSFTPGDKDIIVGRGKVCYMHSGNKRLAQIVQSTLKAYSSAESKKGKSELIKSIMIQIREGSPDGGFVKFDNASGKWYEVGDAIAREKVSQTFRDALNDKYKSSTTSKTLKRKQERISKLSGSSSTASDTKPAKKNSQEKPMPSFSTSSSPFGARFPPATMGLDPLAMRAFGLQRNLALQAAFATRGAGFGQGIDPVSLMLMRREQMARSALLGLSLQQPPRQFS